MTTPIARALTPVGRLFSLAGQVAVLTFKPPFQLREYIEQTWFVTKVSALPTALFTIPFGATIALLLGNLTGQFGAQSQTGAGSVLAIVQQAAPIVTALLISGAGGSAVCADLGARTIREEIAAMEVLGISPIQRLVVPRVLAMATTAVILNGLATVVGVAGGYFFNVIVQGGTPGAYIASFSAIAQVSDILVSEFKAVLFGLVAGIVAAYRGLNPPPGPKGVGDAVNQSVVISFVLVFFINLVLTALYLNIVPTKDPDVALFTGRARRYLDIPVNQLEELGDQLSLYGAAIGWIPRTLRRYRKEVMRLLAEVAFGSGALVVILGTAGVMLSLSLFVGSLVGLQGFRALDSLGVEALTGFITAYFNTRDIAPLVASAALTATLGAGFTAQLGAMRISEEIDALEVMAVPSVPFLVTTRVIAGVIAIIPMYTIGLLASFASARLNVTLLNGLPGGTYDHYFDLFLPVSDILYSYLKVIAFAFVIILIHCYYGYSAKGGPAGVGVAVGRAVRLSIVSAAVLDFFLTLVIYGTDTSVRVAG